MKKMFDKRSRNTITESTQTSQQRTILFAITVLLLAALGCSAIGVVINPDTPVAVLGGVSYWAAETGTPIPTVTVFLGTTTPVFDPTDPPIMITTTPEWTTVTATPILPPPTATPFGFVATPYWVTTTPVYMTSTPEPPVTTTPSMPVYGFTTPSPLETPYYRVGTFYMNSDVYINGPDGVVFNLTDYEFEDIPGEATYHYFTIVVKNHTGVDNLVVPVADVVFVRHVYADGKRITGRWPSQNEPLSSRGLPLAADEQLIPLADEEERIYVIGIATPDGVIDELGVVTDWARPVEGGLPIWFLLEDDPGPDAPYTSAYKPPPPTPIIFDENNTYNPGGPPNGTPPPGIGLWPTNGIVTRGFECVTYFTGVSGAGWGCPPTLEWFHTGVDIANVNGNPIWSPIDGTITYAGPNPTGPDCSTIPGAQPPYEGFGNHIRLQDSSTSHILAHLSTFVLTSGPVTAGQQVAGMGSTGCSTGPHLHWQMYQGGTLIDPASWAGPGPPP